MSIVAAHYATTKAEVKFQVYYGSNNQETVCVDRATFDRLCLEHGGTSLVTFNDVVNTSQRVQKGERAIEVPAYVKRVRNYDHPLTGETVSEVTHSPRTLRLFVR